MSGFAVILRKDNRPPATRVHESMRQALRVFGADRDNLVNHGRFTLIWSHDSGFTPHDVIEAQPVVADDRWLLVFMGFLMHREDLAQELGITGPQADRMADSALVMAAWRAWGEDCLDHLYGPISFVVCDLAKQALFACRGQERGPAIFWHGNDERIVLASSTKPIFCDPAVPREVDELRIADALVLNYEDKERSFFRDVRMVPGGHLLHASPDRLDVTRYYDLGRVRDIRFASDSDYVEAASELLGKAVASAMRATATPAISLSAGLDSPAVAITMLDQIAAGSVPHCAPIKAFTAVPAPFWDGRATAGMLGDETGPVKALARAYPNLDVEFVDAADLSFDHGLDLLQSYADAPMRGLGNLYWGLALARRCREAGSTVMLTGSSGNATLSLAIGDTIFARWLRELRWLTLAREHHAAMRGQPGGTRRYLRKFVGRAVVPNMPDWLYNRYLGSGLGNRISGYLSFSPINPDYAREMDVAGRMADMGWDDRYRKPGTRREMMRIMVERGGRDGGGAIGESFKALTGVQNRDPLGDRRILEFCYAIPDDQFFRHGTDRRLIRRMMAGRLPAEIREAPRGDQSADWHGRMARDLPRIRAELDRLASDPAMAARLDILRLQRLVDNWPTQTPLSAADHRDLFVMRYGIGRALAVARFIHQVEGRN